MGVYVSPFGVYREPSYTKHANVKTKQEKYSLQGRCAVKTVQNKLLLASSALNVLNHMWMGAMQSGNTLTCILTHDWT